MASRRNVWTTQKWI